MLRSKFGKIWRTYVMGKQLAGHDASGNSYYVWQSKDYKGDWQEKREVVLYSPPPDISDYDPNAVPTEWRSWLAGHRRLAPSLEDAQKLQEYRDRVAANAAQVDAQEAKRRLRNATVGPEVGDANMDAFLRQLSGKRGTDAGHMHQQNMAARQKNKEDVQMSSQEEGAGAGDTFKPGQWTPGGKS